MTVTSSIRSMVWERDQGTCGICMSPVPFDRSLHIDHILPKAAGGSDLLTNLRATHARCNLRRGADGHRGLRPAQYTIITSIRLPATLLAQVKYIAQHERRPASEWIRIVLEDAVARYLAEHPELGEADDEQSRARR